MVIDVRNDARGRNLVQGELPMGQPLLEELPWTDSIDDF